MKQTDGLVFEMRVHDDKIVRFARSSDNRSKNNYITKQRTGTSSSEGRWKMQILAWWRKMWKKGTLLMIRLIYVMNDGSIPKTPKTSEPNQENDLYDRLIYIDIRKIVANANKRSCICPSKHPHTRVTNGFSDSSTNGDRFCSSSSEK